MPTHVYFVVWWFDRFGGMERHVTQLALALAARDVRVTVFSETPLPDSNDYVRTLRAATIRIIAPPYVRARGPRGGRRGADGLEGQHLSPQMADLLDAMAEHARTTPPDVVHVHGCRLGQAYVLKWAAARGYASVYTEHVTIGDWGGPFDADAPGIVEGVADAIACVSEYSRESLQQQFSRPRDIAVVKHIIDDPARSESINGPRVNRAASILAVGRLAPHKGYATLLEAVARLRDEGLAFHLRIAGEGEQRAALEALCADLGLADAVTLLGEVDHHTVASLWRAADIGVLPSLTEGLPLSVVEAMAQGKPIVASRVGGIPEVVRHDENGLLVEPGEAAPLAAALVRLITEPDLAARLGAAARQSFESGGWSEVAVSSQMLAIYASAARVRTERLDQSEVDGPGWSRRQAARAAQPIRRVVVCVWSLSGFGDMEAVITEQASALAWAGVAVTLYVERPVRPFNRYVATLRRAGVRVVTPSIPGFVAQRGWERMAGTHTTSLMRAFARDIALHAPDVVHIHGWRLACGWLRPALQLAAERGVRAVYTEHAGEAGAASPDATSRETIGMFDQLSATSPAAAAHVSGAVAPRPVLSLRHAGKTGPTAAPDPAEGREVRVFTLVPPHALAPLQRGLAGSSLRLDPADPATAQASQIGDCDFAVLSPQAPEFGTALVEAMAAFKPVVICGEPGASLIRHRANGLVAAADPTAALLELAADPLLAKQFALGARRVFETEGGRTLAIVAEVAALYRAEAGCHAGG